MEKKKIMLIACSLMAGRFSVAQTEDTTRQVSLSEVNVIASRIQKNNLETPASITVITAAQILERGYTSLADVLSDAGSIYLTGNGQVPGANESIFMRGANSNQTVILVDGVRMSDASTVNNTLDLSELPLADIDRIEIIRGAHSTLYGAGAIGGVISITTKQGKAQRGLHGTVDATGGTFGSKTSYGQGQASVRYMTGKGIFASAAVEKVLSTGMDATLDTVTDPAVYKNRDDDGWDRLYWHAGAGFKNQRLNLALNYQSTKMNTDLDKGAYTDDDNYLLTFRRNLFSANVSYKFSPVLSTQLSGGYTDTERNSDNDSSVTDAAGDYDHTVVQATYGGKFTTADWQLNAHFPKADFLAGVSYRKEEMEQHDYYLSKAFGTVFELKNDLDTISPAETFGVFLHADLNGSLIFRKCDKFNLAAGIRYNHHSQSGDFITGEINPSYKLSNDALVYFSWSAGFNTPSLYQYYAPDIYFPYDGTESIHLTRGNKDLKPETSSSFEFGIRQQVTEKILYQVSFFHSITKDLIEYVYLWNKSVAVDTLGNDFMRDDFRGDRYLNIGKQRTTGIEFSIQSTLHEKLKMVVNGSLLSGNIEYSPSLSINEQTDSQHVQLYSNGAYLEATTKVSGLVRRPNTASLSLIYSPVKSFSVIPAIRYVGSRNDIYYNSSLGPYGALSTNVIEDYTLLSLSLRWNISELFSVMLRGENITDQEYQEIYGFSTRGRSFYFSARFSF